MRFTRSLSSTVVAMSRRDSFYGSKPNVPDYYTNASGTFRILSDHLGMPTVVINTSTGAVVERLLPSRTSL